LKYRRILFDDVDADPASKRNDKVQGGLILNIVTEKGAQIFELLSSKKQALLVGRNIYPLRNGHFDVINGHGRLYCHHDRLPREYFHENLRRPASMKNCR